MSEESYVVEAKERIGEEVECVLQSLASIAEERFLEVDWVIQQFKEKFNYKTKNI